MEFEIHSCPPSGRYVRFPGGLFDNPYDRDSLIVCMRISKPRGVRLLVTGLLMAALVGAVVLPVSGATAGAADTMAVSSGTTVPAPLGTTGSTATTTTVTTTKVTPSPTTKETAAKTTTATTKSTTAPATVKTSTPATTTPKTTAPTTAPTTKAPATTAPTYEAPATPSLPPAAAVVAAPTIVPGSFTVPAGTGIFSVTSVGNVPVGGDGVVQLIVDNGWTPLFGDTYVDISWDPSMVTYQSSAIKVLNTTAAVSSDRSVRVMLGDFRRGYPQGRYPLAAITLRALREGTSTLSVSVDHVRYWSSDFTEFTDVTATASGRSGIFSTGALPAETQPLVTFTQNTLAPVSYPTNDIDAGVGTTTQTTATTTAPTTVTTVETVATQPPATEVTTVVPSPSVNQTPYGSYAPVSTRVQTSGFPAATVVAVSLAILGGVALLVHRRR